MKNYLLFFSLVTMLSSCNESDDLSSLNNSNQEVLILSKMESIITNSTTETNDIIEFNYDTNDTNLMGYDYLSPDWPDYSVDYIYLNDQLIEVDDYTVTYDGDLITLLSADRKAEYFLENDRIVKYKWYQFDANNSTFNLLVTNEFTFDDEFENVIKSEQFDSNGELFTYSDFEYDNKINPSSNFNPIINVHEYLLGGTYNSKNNPIRREDYHSSNNFSNAQVAHYSYIYNESNYPIHLSYQFETFNLERDYFYLE